VKSEDYVIEMTPWTDAQSDADPDGMTNLEEYNAATDPNDSDSDDDNMPDHWEHTHGLAPLDPNDADGDQDQDEYSNIVEFIHGSDPNDPNSLSEPNMIIVPTDVNSIQSAIDVSIAGDVIEVRRPIIINIDGSPNCQRCRS
jgi:hypothetical protein